MRSEEDGQYGRFAIRAGDRQSGPSNFFTDSLRVLAFAFMRISGNSVCRGVLLYPFR
jgi:hypothetical protein